jgi:hypothetical protein
MSIDKKFKSMKKRAYKRHPASLTVNFHYDNAIYTGTVVNCSDNDMFIKMEMPCQLSSVQKQFEVRIPLKDKVLLSTAHIKRMETIGKEINGIGVKLEYPIPLEKLIDK